MAEQITAIPYVVIAETRLDSFEYLATFDHVLDYPVELWHLAFSFRIEPDERIRWGTYEPVDGWLTSPYSGFNDLTTTLVIPAGDMTGASELVLAIPWWLDGGGNTPWELEVSLRAFLEHEGLIPPISFPGSHYLMYFEFGSYDFMQNRLLLSRPFGSNSIWVVERWMQLDGTVHHNRIPQSDTLSMQEFFEYQQAQFEAGNANWLADPHEVARVYMELHGWGDVPFMIKRYITNTASLQHTSPLFVVLEEFIANAQGETKASVVSLNAGGTAGVLVLDLYGVPTATLLYTHGDVVQHADLGPQYANIVSSISSEGQLVRITNDGNRQSYTILTISVSGNLVPRMTIFAENAGVDGQAKSYYLIHGFPEDVPRENWTSITYDAFHDVRVSNGLDNLLCVWSEMEDQTHNLQRMFNFNFAGFDR